MFGFVYLYRCRRAILPRAVIAINVKAAIARLKVFQVRISGYDVAVPEPVINYAVVT